MSVSSSFLLRDPAEPSLPALAAAGSLLNDDIRMLSCVSWMTCSLLVSLTQRGPPSGFIGISPVHLKFSCLFELVWCSSVPFLTVRALQLSTLFFCAVHTLVFRFWTCFFCVNMSGKLFGLGTLHNLIASRVASTPRARALPLLLSPTPFRPQVFDSVSRHQSAP